VFAAFALTYAAGVLLRLSEAPKWAGEALHAGGEKILATHDGYTWLAGALDLGRHAGAPLSTLVAFVSGVTGFSVGTAGFWMPVYLAPLAALPVCLAAGRAGRPEAGLLAGAWTVAAGGFLMRTRMGYLDTDVFSLFFALGAAAGLYAWLGGLCRSRLLRDSGDAASPVSLARAWFWALALGVFLHVSTIAYSSGRPIIWAVLLAGALAGLILARPGERGTLLLGLCVMVAAWRLGLAGVAGAGLVILLGFFNERLARRAAFPLALAFLGLFLALRGAAEFSSIAGLVASYLKPGGASTNPDASSLGLNLPQVMQSVREATNPSWNQVTYILAGHTAWLLAGLAGVAVTLVRRPLFLVFVPLLVLALASARLGVRFTMFGGPVLGLGLGLAITDLLARRGRVMRYGLMAALAAGVCFIFYGQIADRRVKPVLSAPLAETFTEVGELSREDAVIWTWWDFGYAAQYFSGRDTFADGARQNGEYVYPLALAHSTASPKQAAQVMTFMAAEREKVLMALEEQGEKGGERRRFPSVRPMSTFAGMAPCQVRVFFESLANLDYPPRVEVPERYLVLAWDNLPVSGWIARFGTWDLAQGMTRDMGLFMPPAARTSFDLSRGRVVMGDKTYALQGMILVHDTGEPREFEWENGSDAYCVANSITGQVFMMDKVIFESMMVRMLLGDPGEFAGHFELVADRSPWARAYRVR